MENIFAVQRWQKLKTISSSSPFLLRFPSVAVLFSDWLSSSDDYGVVSVPIFVEHIEEEMERKKK